MLATECGEAILERRAGYFRGASFAEEPPDWFQCTAAVTTLTDLLDCLQLEKVQSVGLLPSGLKACEADEFRQVEERAGHGAHGYPSLEDSILRMEPTAMNPDSLSPVNALAPGRGGYVHNRARLPGKAPECRRAAVAEQRSLAIRQNCRKPSPLEAQMWVTDGIDAAMHNSQASICKSALELRWSEADRKQLPPGHQASLLIRQL